MFAASLLIALTLAQGTERVEVDPVACWWRTTAAAVRVGEPFDVVLTCSLLQTEGTRVVADESRLDPAVVQLQPFDVISGRRAADLSTEGRRFIQYEYRLRAVAESMFASEVAVPGLEITYRVESRAGERSTLEGRDLTYAMPPLTMRVVSLVPDTAGDIREAPLATFAEIERLRSRATMLRAGAAVAIAVGVILIAVAVGRSVRRRRADRTAVARTLAPAAILTGVRRQLARIQDEARVSGWTERLVGEALAAVRIVAAYATGRPVAQRRAHPARTTAASGELIVGASSRGSAVWSTIASTDDGELRAALEQLTAARYGRGDGTRLDGVIQAALDRTDRLIANRPLRERLWTRFTS